MHDSSIEGAGGGGGGSLRHYRSLEGLADDEAEEGTYFGNAGQDFMLKRRRAQMAHRICLLDVMALLGFTTQVALVRLSSPEENGWLWDWSKIPWSLVSMTIARVMVLAFTVRFSHGNYNVAVLFVCGVNMVIQSHIEVAAVVIAQYIFSILITQMHWISYSAHTPMSATLAYAYDPILSDSITFSRESRYMGSSSSPLFSGHGHNLGRPPVRRGTSYGTMSGSPFDAVQELDEEEEEDDDRDAFIKVNVDFSGARKKHRFGQSRRRRSESRSSSPSSSSESDGHGRNGSESGRRTSTGAVAQGDIDDDEDQDIAVLLAFQDARRQQVFAFSPTASSSVLPARSILSPQGAGSPSSSTSSQLNKAPLPWTFRPQDSFSSSYDMRIAAAGNGATTVAGGGGATSLTGVLTAGYTPRKRATRRSNFDPQGTGRKTWTGGHSIIYSGILLESSEDEVNNGDDEEDDTVDQNKDAVAVMEEDENGDLEFKIQGEIGVDDEHAAECTQALEMIESSETVTTSHETKSTRQVTITATTTTATTDDHELDPSAGEDGVIDGVLSEQAMSDMPVDVTLKVEVDDSEQVQDCGEVTDVNGVVDPKKLSQSQGLASNMETSSVSGKDVLGPTVRPTANKDLDSVLTFHDDQVDDHDASGNLSSDRGGHGVSAVKVKVKSSKQITAVLCEDENCQEHPRNLGGLPQDVDLGLNFLKGLNRANIVDLNIKESSRASVERTGPGAEEEGSVDLIHDGGKIRHPELGTIDLNGSVDFDKLIGPLHKNDGANGARELHVRERVEKTTVVESEDAPECSHKGVAVIPVVDPSSTSKTVPVSLSPPNEPSDDIDMEGGQRRVHLRERTEKVTLEEEGGLRGVNIGIGAVGGAVLVENQPGVIAVDQDRPVPMPGGWVGIQEQPSGAVTWGYATDIDQPTTVVLEPTMVIAPEQPMVIEPGPIIQTVEPTM
ncbi:hypothetical protein BG004_000937, partial [Podila humilis]